MNASERHLRPATREIESQSCRSPHEQPVWPLQGSVEIDTSAAIFVFRARAANFRWVCSGLNAVIRLLFADDG